VEEEVKLQPACPLPCSSCPWRRENQGKPHPHGWFSKANLRRLWSGLKDGESMSCHQTDPTNEVPEGETPVPDGREPHECTGALILQQREVMKLQSAGAMVIYKGSVGPAAITRGAFFVMANRLIFEGMIDGKKLSRPDLNCAAVHYAPLGEWVPR
jgi:hypothetical protein